MRRLLLSATLLPALVWGGNVSYDDACGYGKLEVGVGLLALRPSICETDYAILDSRTFTPQNVQGALPDGVSRSIDPEYEIGVRAAIGYGSRRGCFDGRVEYTFLHSRHAQTAQGTPTLWPTLAHPTLPSPLIEFGIENFDRLRSQFDYDAVDLQFAVHSEEKRCLYLRSYAGLHFLNLDHKIRQEIHGVAPITIIGNEIEIFDQWCDRRYRWGIGPLIGFDGCWRFHRALALTGHVGMALVTGGAQWRRIEVVTLQGEMAVTETLNVGSHRCHALTPYLRGSLGITYCLHIPWAYQLTGELAYEFHSYINGMGLFRFNDQRATGTFQNKSFNLDGLVLMIRLVV